MKISKYTDDEFGATYHEIFYINSLATYNENNIVKHCVTIWYGKLCKYLQYVSSSQLSLSLFYDKNNCLLLKYSIF